MLKAAGSSDISVRMRRRGGQSNRARTAVKFMIEYYEERELQQIISSISKECLNLPPGQRGDHFVAIEQISSAHREPLFRSQLVCSIDPKVFECSDSTQGLKMLKSEIERSKENLRVEGEKTGEIQRKPKDSDRDVMQKKQYELLAAMIQKEPGIFKGALE